MDYFIKRYFLKTFYLLVVFLSFLSLFSFIHFFFFFAPKFRHLNKQTSTSRRKEEKSCLLSCILVLCPETKWHNSYILQSNLTNYIICKSVRFFELKKKSSQEEEETREITAAAQIQQEQPTWLPLTSRSGHRPSMTSWTYEHKYVIKPCVWRHNFRAESLWLTFLK